MTTKFQRSCVSCHSQQVRLRTRRSLGAWHELDQYVTCLHCGRITYETVTVTHRELRSHGYRVNTGLTLAGTAYRIRQIIRIGIDEYLLHVHPLSAEEQLPTLMARAPVSTRQNRPARHSSISTRLQLVEGFAR